MESLENLATWRRLGNLYLATISLTVVTATFAFYVWGTQPWIKAQSPGIVVTLVGFCTAFALWVIAPRSARITRLYLVFLCLYLFSWLVITLLAEREGAWENHTAWLAPLLLLMLAVKPPSWSMVRTASDTFAVGLVAIAALSHLLHVFGIYPFPHYFYPGRGLQLLLPPEFLDSLGLLYRWEGPFGSVSDAAPVGAFLLVYSLVARSWVRWISAIGGAFILLFAGAWTALFATTAGLLSVMWLSPAFGRLRLGKGVKWVVTLLFAGVSLGYLILNDPTFNGRIPIWEAYVSLWPRDPLLGIGGSGISQNLSTLLNGHAHNYYVDTLLRYGALGLAITVTTFIVVGIMAFRAAKRGRPQLAGMFVTFITALLGESLLLWRYIGYVQWELILIALLSCTWLEKIRHKPLATDGHLLNS